jgi:hypothetical protein
MIDEHFWYIELVHTVGYEFIVKIIINYYYLCIFVATGDTEQLVMLFKSDSSWSDFVRSLCCDLAKIATYIHVWTY